LRDTAATTKTAIFDGCRDLVGAKRLHELQGKVIESRAKQT